MTNSTDGAIWPELPLDSWRETQDTLHMWMQIVGKVRLALAPMLNHWWQVPFYATPRGLTTSVIPYRHQTFDVLFDFHSHELVIRVSDGQTRHIPLYPRSVADFYGVFMSTLKELSIDVHIWTMPVEVTNPIPFTSDNEHAAYDPDAVSRFWHIVSHSAVIFEQFRSGFIGKHSPVHFFWGSFDLAYTRFSGRTAPPRTDPDPILRRIMNEAYSHEGISFGWWPGAGPLATPAYYAYVIPEPDGCRTSPVSPAEAYYDTQLGEFILKYDDVRLAESPSEHLLSFLQSTYETSATLARWDRAALERPQTP